MSGEPFELDEAHSCEETEAPSAASSEAVVINLPLVAAPLSAVSSVWPPKVNWEPPYFLAVVWAGTLLLSSIVPKISDDPPPGGFSTLNQTNRNNN